MPDPTTDSIAAIDARLAGLQRDSEARTAELRAIAAQLPAVVGRRAMIRALVGDALAHPDRGEVVRRGLDKVARIPIKVRDGVGHRLGRVPPAD